MWINFTLSIKDVETRFDENEGMYYIDFSTDKMFELAISNTISFKEVSKKVDNMFALKLYLTTEDLRALFQKFQETPFYLNSIVEQCSTDDINTRLVDGFIYRNRCFYVHEKDGYKNFIIEGSIPNSKLVYVYLHDPENKSNIIKEGFIIRSRWKKYKRQNNNFKYKGKIYKLSDFNPVTEYMSSLHYMHDYRLVL